MWGRCCQKSLLTKISCLTASKIYLLIFQEYYKADLISDIWRGRRRMGWISFNEISLWDAFMILVFISGHLFEYEKQPIIRLRWLNISFAPHAVIQSCFQLEGFLFFIVFGFSSCIFFFSSWQEQDRRPSSQEIMNYPRGIIFSFLRIHTCARHHWTAVMFSIFPLWFLVLTLLRLFQFIFTNLCLKLQEGKKEILIRKGSISEKSRGNASTALEIQYCKRYWLF